MTCFGDYGFNEKEIDGKCAGCGEPTVCGVAFNTCSYSPVECKACDHRPCDGSC